MIVIAVSLPRSIVHAGAVVRANRRCAQPLTLCAPPQSLAHSACCAFDRIWQRTTRSACVEPSSSASGAGLQIALLRCAHEMVRRAERERLDRERRVVAAAGDEVAAVD